MAQTDTITPETRPKTTTDPWEHVRSRWDQDDWAAFEALYGSSVGHSAVEFGNELASMLGYCSSEIESDDEIIPCPNGDDIVRALRTQLPAAQVLRWLCEQTTVEMPESLRKAANAYTPLRRLPFAPSEKESQCNS